MGKRRGRALRARDYRPFDITPARSPSPPPPLPPGDLRQRFPPEEAIFIQEQIALHNIAWARFNPDVFDHLERANDRLPPPVVFASLATEYALHACNKREQRIAMDTIAAYSNAIVDLSTKFLPKKTDEEGGQWNIFTRIVTILVKAINGIKGDITMGRDRESRGPASAVVLCSRVSFVQT